MRALQEAAIRVPEDISIIGFNDISVAKYVSPTLTTVKVHTEWMGELAVETMKELCLNPQFLEKLLSERNSFSEIQRNIHQNNSKTWRVFPSFALCAGFQQSRKWRETDATEINYFTW